MHFTHRYSLVAGLASVLGFGSLGATDHSELVTGPIATGPEATRQCLECHDEAAVGLMKTTHWTWSSPQEVDGRKIDLGKVNAINNFCIALASNEPRCTSCHVGYGWKDAKFDFTDKTAVDCLVCHDTTGTYKKTPTGAGLPDPSVDLLAVAQKVGLPSRATCGACHFQGGGGDAVKHGDLDSSLTNPGPGLDIHMARDGLNFSCQKCHEFKGHELRGNALVASPGGTNHLDCESCHKSAPHKESRLNAHVRRVACQTCHIPEVAKEVPTKVFWDWSKAGQDLQVIPHDAYGKALYAKMKGEFVFAKNLVPTYRWYNGKAGVHLMRDKLGDPGTVTSLSYPLGERADAAARIFPFKVHDGVQPYDPAHGTLIVAKLFGPDGYWKHYDWKKASALGMAAVGMPFGGEVGWAKTRMYWKINHMVAPKAQALRCLDCHGDHGRMDWAALGYPGDPMAL